MYNKVSDYYKEKYGSKIYKLSLKGADTCPNRDGRVGVGGCIFCSRKGSGEFCEEKIGSVSEQLERAKERVAKKIKDGKYIAYLQSFSNTYGDVNYLKRLFLEAIKPDYIVGIAIGTRPDCLGDEILDVLSEINTKKPVTIELGLQTSNDKTAEYINRCYKTQVFDTAVKKLKARGIEVVAHMIIGLPFESEEDMLNTARHIANSGADGIKFHLLHILKDTKLAEEYEKGVFSALDLETYAQILKNCIEAISPKMTVHRITGDPPKSELIAPLWSADKKRVLNYINKYFKDQNLVQGKNYKAPF
ncbi:MAG: TIGR01212 family radical SAM protein [Clostridia bacterium]|nr:TIGR01212 family radical SAM protein [Clostridia bacterium]